MALEKLGVKVQPPVLEELNEDYVEPVFSHE